MSHSSPPLAAVLNLGCGRKRREGAVNVDRTARNTLELVDIQVSDPLMAQVRARPEQFEIVGKPEPLKFDVKGTLYPMLAPHHEAAHA